MVECNGTVYRYVHNLQGDIVGILDSAGSLVVEYRYDAWGKPLSVMGTLADTLGKRNPFRYRGYVYDEETGLYYLRSRYYNPEVGRFVNADTLLGIYIELLSVNSYCYRINASVAYDDQDGLVAFGSQVPTRKILDLFRLVVEPRQKFLRILITAKKIPKETFGCRMVVDMAVITGMYAAVIVKNTLMRIQQ